MGGINVNALLESATTRVLSSHEISMISEKLIMDPAIIAQFDINDEKVLYCSCNLTSVSIDSF